MEEADTLCNRIGILTHGNLRCLGSSQDLKERYGNGYFLTIKIDSIYLLYIIENINNIKEKQDKIEELIQNLYENVKLKKDSTPTIRTYHILDKNINLSKLFKQLEDNKTNLSIIEYSIIQTTLDDVFLFFADEGKEDDNDI